MVKKTRDKNTLTRRVGRYARVSARAGGLAARLAGEKYLGVEIDRARHAGQLRAALGALKGPLLKVAQLLATIPEALPPEYAAELQTLQADAPSMGWPFVKRRMSTELGANWQEKFRQFEKIAAAAASLGQVHKAVTRNGLSVACKLQYPDMASAVEADLNQLKIIMKIFESVDGAVSTKYIQGEIAARLREELDYRLEARHCRLYGYMLRDEKGVCVPEIIDGLSTDRLLTSTWLEGEKILSLKGESAANRQLLALNIFRAWYVPFYFYGVIHGDPHPGNYAARPDRTINLLDFGCVRIFPPRFVKGVIDLYHALRTNDRDLAVSAYESWGFKNPGRELVDVLNIWAGFLYGPVMDDKVRPIGEVKGGVYGRETASLVHQELKKLGGVSIPREFVFMDRAALGLGSVFLHLKAEVNWHRLFNEMIADFDVKTLARRQAAALKKFDLRVPDSP